MMQYVTLQMQPSVNESHIHLDSTLQFVINTVCLILNDKLADDNYRYAQKKFD